MIKKNLYVNGMERTVFVEQSDLRTSSEKIYVLPAPRLAAAKASVALATSS